MAPPERDKEGRRARRRPAGGRQSQSSPAPIIAAVVGIVVLGMIFLALSNSRGRRQQTARTPDAPPAPAAASSPGQTPAQAPQYAPVNPTAPAAPAATPGNPAPAQPMAATQIMTVRLETEGGLDPKRGDTRKISPKCPQCGADVGARASACGQCHTRLEWPSEIDCPFCKSGETGVCGVCKGTAENPLFNPNDRLPFGMSRSESSYTGDARCFSCRGDKRCRHCGGSGKVELSRYLRR